MPHCHMCIILDEPYRFYTTDQYDDVVCCELPDPITEPELYKIITKSHLHGPCGINFPNSPCMVDNKCSKNFPKQFQDETTVDKNGFPIYRRRPGQHFQKNNKGFIFDNRWVVGYNKHLSQKYQAHINVEICSTVSAIKYLYKYMYKGHDRTVAKLNNVDDDEIKKFVDARYVAQEECIWRTLKFEMQDHFPAVESLALHLENQQSILFKNNANFDDILQNSKDTQLTAFFKKNLESMNARNITYSNFIHYYVWDKTKKVWKDRKRGGDKIMARIRSASPREGEVFYLKILLHHVAGALSFQDLKIYNGIVSETYKEACIKRGLLADDSEWMNCLSEAASVKMPSSMRFLFSIILTHCEPSEPFKLWSKFKIDFCEDFLYKRKKTQPDAEINSSDENSALIEIEHFLNQNNLSLANFPPMPLPDTSKIVSNKFIDEELNYDLIEENVKYNDKLKQLNNEQKSIFDQINNAMQGDPKKIFFVDGPGGTGKSFLFNMVLNKIRSEGKIALGIASSGIAATLLENGRTAHSRFKIPININETSTCSIPKQSQLAELLRKTEILIWDEISMTHKHIIECVDRSMQDIRQDNRPFGGVVVIFGGDFRQILPVIPHGCRAEIVDSTFKRSSLWPIVQKLQLKKNIRAKNCKSYADFLLKVGEGRISHQGSYDKIQIPTEMFLKSQSIDDMIKFIYFDENGKLDHKTFLKNSILAPKNEFVEKINRSIVDIMQGEEIEYVSADEVVDEDNGVKYPTEFLNSIEVSGLPANKIKLKVGCPIILIRNLNSSAGLSNGTKMIVTNLFPHLIEAELDYGLKKRVLIPRITLIPTDSSCLPCSFKRRQFPIKIGFALTINKAQGQTLEKVGIILQTPVFTHGQLYVGLSRAGTQQNVKILTNNTDIIENVVFREVLQN